MALTNHGSLWVGYDFQGVTEFARVDILEEADRDVRGKDEHEEVVRERQFGDEHQDEHGEKKDVDEVEKVVLDNLPIGFRRVLLNLVFKPFLDPLLNLRIRKADLGIDLERFRFRDPFFHHGVSFHSSLLKQTTGSFLAASKAGMRPLSKASKTETPSIPRANHGESQAISVNT